MLSEEDSLVEGIYHEQLNICWPEYRQHIPVLYFLVIWVWKSRQSMQRPNKKQQRLSWAINYSAPFFTSPAHTFYTTNVVQKYGILEAIHQYIFNLMKNGSNDSVHLLNEVQLRPPVLLNESCFCYISRRGYFGPVQETED